MATQNQVRAILSAIRAANHSVSVVDIARENGMPPTIDEIQAVIDQLVSAEYVKGNREYPGTYFTRKPKRDAIDSFLAHTAILPGIAFDEPAIVVGQTIAEELVILGPIGASIVNQLAILRYLRHQSNAAKIAPCRALEGLIGNEIIKEHRDKPGFYFVRKGKRDVVDTLLHGGLTLAEMLGACSTDDLMSDATLDSLDAMRGTLDAILDSRDR